MRIIVVAFLVALSISVAAANPVDNQSREFDTFRLPNTTIPTHYEIYLDTDVHLGVFEYTGHVMISISVRENTDQIVLHSVRNVIDNIALLDSNQLPVALSGYSFDEEKDFLVIETNEVLPVGSNYVLDIQFTNNLDRTDKAGFYRSSYENDAGEIKHLALTQFESCSARSAFPCYDEPGIKTTYNVKIACGLEYHAKSNSPALAVEILDGGKKLTTFETTPRMQTYLVAFLVSDFIAERQVVQTPKQLAVSTLARPTAAHLISYSVDASVKFLRELEIYFNQSYAMSKIDNAAINDNEFAAGAMENWGLVTYRESAIFFDPEQDGEDRQLGVVSIVGHEYAHQFFGNLLAPKWWSYVWLNEGFAAFYQYYVAEFSHPEFNMRDRFNHNAAFSVDGSPTIRPMTYYVETTGEISRLFDTIAYSKSASVLCMMNYALSEETFQKGLRYYIQQNKENGVVDENDLFNALDQAAVEDARLPLSMSMHEVFGSWSNQPGVPVVTVERVGESSEFIFNQKRFFDEPQEDAAEETWWIPIFYSTSSYDEFASSTAFWMPPHVSEVSYKITLLEDDLLLVNPLGRGYYRVNYDPQLWQGIISRLYENIDSIHKLSRARLIDDSMNLAHAGLLDYYTAFNVFDYLQEEIDYIPWETAAFNLKFLQRMLRHDEVALNNLENYSAQLAGKLLSTYGFDSSENESADVKDARYIALEWACKRDTQCQTEATKRFGQLKRSTSTVITKSDQIILCSRMRQANCDDFSNVMYNLKNTRDQRIRKNLMENLACVENKSLIFEYLNYLVANDLGVDDKLKGIQAVYQNSYEGYDAVLSMLSVSADLEIDFNFTDRQIQKLLENIADYTVEPIAAAKLVSLVKRESPKLLSTIQNKLQSNENWVRRNAATVSNMLKISSLEDI